MKDPVLIVYTKEGNLVPAESLSWWKKDKDGWPIESIKGRPIFNLLHLICQNIRKITG